MSSHCTFRVCGGRGQRRGPSSHCWVFFRVAGKERRGSWGVVDGEEDPEMSMLLLLASSQGKGQRKDPNYNTCVAYKFLTRWEDRRAPWRVVGGEGWGRGSRDVHAPVIGKFAGEGAEERS
jgi:hypothetical protein